MSKGKVKWCRDPKAVIIGWQDAQSIRAGWQTPKDMRKWALDESWARVKTLGFLLGESKHYYILTACTQAEGGFYSHCQRIPKGCVTDIEVLKRSKQRRCGHKLVPTVRR